MLLADIQIVTNGLRCDYLHIPPITLLFYDHILAFKTETKYLWKRQLNNSMYLFFFHRYFNAIATTINFVTVFGNLPVSCKTLKEFREGILIVTQVVVLVIMTLRIYALYGCNKRLLFLLLTVIAVGSCVAIVMTFTAHLNSQLSLASGTARTCSVELDSNGIDYPGEAVAWIVIFTYDALLFGLSMHNAFKTRQELRIIQAMFKDRACLKAILLRDGLNLANILSFYASPDCMRGGLAPLTSSISVILVSRMLLNLHQVADTGIYSSQTSSRDLDYYQDNNDA
ncbi:hypothetical protein GYMLUDRAFT_71336 [Collybiopsis luxurians FD-317 M1]|nr:hypothetical protein GYMLUDRAFT_71336 [Collybiopsis luxurians FD-317 M1]